MTSGARRRKTTGCVPGCQRRCGWVLRASTSPSGAESADSAELTPIQPNGRGWKRTRPIGHPAGPWLDDHLELQPWRCVRPMPGLDLVRLSPSAPPLRFDNVVPSPSSTRTVYTDAIPKSMPTKRLRVMLLLGCPLLPARSRSDVSRLPATVPRTRPTPRLPRLMCYKAARPQLSRPTSLMRGVVPRQV